eukprot:m.175160 g.175160  ORF g.175160 m.175160 type:complete len:1055 (-) comp10420_c0_seq19:47-3211(-)
MAHLNDSARDDAFKTPKNAARTEREVLRQLTSAGDPTQWLAHLDSETRRLGGPCKHLLRHFERAQNSIDPDQHKRSEAFICLLLELALLKRKLDTSVDSIRDLFEFMQRGQIGRTNRLFYTQWADFESDQGNLDKVNTITRSAQAARQASPDMKKRLEDFKAFLEGSTPACCGNRRSSGFMATPIQSSLRSSRKSAEFTLSSVREAENPPPSSSVAAAGASAALSQSSGTALIPPSTVERRPTAMARATPVSKDTSSSAARHQLSSARRRPNLGMPMRVKRPMLANLDEDDDDAPMANCDDDNGDDDQNKSSERRPSFTRQSSTSSSTSSSQHAASPTAMEDDDDDKENSPAQTEEVTAVFFGNKISSGERRARERLAASFQVGAILLPGQLEDQPLPALAAHFAARASQAKGSDLTEPMVMEDDDHSPVYMRSSQRSTAAVAAVVSRAQPPSSVTITSSSAMMQAPFNHGSGDKPVSAVPRQESPEASQTVIFFNRSATRSAAVAETQPPPVASSAPSSTGHTDYGTVFQTPVGRQTPASRYGAAGGALPSSRLAMQHEQQMQALQLQMQEQHMQQQPQSEQLPQSWHAEDPGKVVLVSGRYFKKIACIGQGGSSQVYRVLSVSNDVFALKEVDLAKADEYAVKSYINEISVLQALQGEKNIVQLEAFEVNEQKHVIYIVMEIGSTDLQGMLKQRRAATGERTIDENHIRLHWQQMLEAVHSIHKQRIIHTDLKPANFLNVDGALKLIDFGIAGKIQDDHTSIERESAFGTFNYMSPEAITAGTNSQGGKRLKVGPASDVWSLACILYLMVYGRTPFHHLQPYQKLLAITNPQHEIEFKPLRNKALLDVLKRCLTRDPKQRPTIEELLAHPFLNPIPATPPRSAGYMIATPSKAAVNAAQLAEILAQMNSAAASPMTAARHAIKAIQAGQPLQLARSDYPAHPQSQAFRQSSAPAPPPLFARTGSSSGSSSSQSSGDRPLQQIDVNSLRSVQARLKPVTQREVTPRAEDEPIGLAELVRRQVDAKFKLAHPSELTEDAGGWTATADSAHTLMS